MDNKDNHPVTQRLSAVVEDMKTPEVRETNVASVALGTPDIIVSYALPQLSRSVL